VANGMASLVAHAYDAAGNVTASVPVAVNVSNASAPAPSPAPAGDVTPPQVRIVSPGASVGAKGGVTVSTSASDDAGAAGITQRLFIDGRLVATAAGGSLVYSWNTKRAGAGTHTIQVMANDASQNTSSTTLSVQVIR